MSYCPEDGTEMETLSIDEGEYLCPGCLVFWKYNGGTYSVVEDPLCCAGCGKPIGTGMAYAVRSGEVEDNIFTPGGDNSEYFHSPSQDDACHTGHCLCHESHGCH